MTKLLLLTADLVGYMLSTGNYTFKFLDFMAADSSCTAQLFRHARQAILVADHWGYQMHYYSTLTRISKQAHLPRCTFQKVPLHLFGHCQASCSMPIQTWSFGRIIYETHVDFL